MEEATDCLGRNQESREKIEQHLQSLFENGVEIYRGYVDDPRNTDNAWMETIAYNFHDEDDSVFKNFSLTAGKRDFIYFFYSFSTKRNRYEICFILIGDDAGSVTWMDMDGKLKLYASHKQFVEKAAALQNAHW